MLIPNVDLMPISTAVQGREVEKLAIAQRMMWPSVVALLRSGAVPSFQALYQLPHIHLNVSRVVGLD